MIARPPTLSFQKLANRYSIGAARVLSMQFAAAALSFTVSFLLAKLVGAAGLGLYFLSMTSIDVCSTLSRLGLDTAALKFISIANSSDDRGVVATIYRRCVVIAAVSAAFLILPASLLLAWSPIGADRHAEFETLLPLLMIAVIPVTLLPVQTESLKAIGRPGAAVFIQAVLPQLTLALLVALLAWRGIVTMHLVMTAYACGFFFAIIVAFARWVTIERHPWQSGHFSTRVLLRTSLPMLTVTGLNLVMAWTDTLVLGILSDTEQVGIYGAALRISATATFILIAVNSVVAPQFAALYSSGRHAELEAMVRRSSFWTLAISAPLILTFMVFPAEILGVFGAQFTGGAWSLRLLALAQFINVSTGPLSSLLLMTGHEKLMRTNMLFSATLNLVGNLVLVPLLGALGAAISTAISISVMKLTAWWIVWYKLHINAVNHLNL